MHAAKCDERLDVASGIQTHGEKSVCGILGFRRYRENIE